MGRAGRVDAQGLRIPDVRQVRQETHAVDELLPGFHTTLDAEAQNRSAATGQVLAGVGVEWMAGQARVVHPLHGRVLFEMPSDRERVLTVPRHPQVQCLQTLQKQEGREGAHAASHVAQKMRPALQDVRDVADRLDGLGKHDAVIGRVGFGEFRPLRGLGRPIEVARIDDTAADMEPVPPDELRAAVHVDVDPVLERPKQRRRRHGVVAEQRKPALVGDTGDLDVVRHIVLGVADRLDEDATGVGVHQLPDRLGLGRIEELHRDAQLRQRLGEERPGPAVEAGRRDEVLSGVADVQDRRGNREHPA